MSVTIVCINPWNRVPETDTFVTYLRDTTNTPVNVACTSTAGSTYLFMRETITAADKFESFSDGMQLGWAVAAAMVTVYVIRRVFR